MKLDSRIKKGKTYLDCFHTEAAKKFVEKECYIVDEISDFSDLSDVTKATLINIAKSVTDTQPYTLSDKESTYKASLILPCEWVEEPKYRPYTHTEFCKDFKLGDEISFRRADNKSTQLHSLFIEYLVGKRDVKIGSYWYTFDELCEKYEVYTKDGEWKPFGIKE